ncbi:MAG: beta-ketoacyl-ACP synthase II [Paludibacteraceae bacterium]|nr:beta-ketoacyl-ACP synthase II [Paludibacteraceae bacterium]
MELKRVVVTGLGAITPVGNTVPSMWDSIVNGQSGAAMITHFDADLFKTRFACEVKNFVASDYIDPKMARKMNPFCQYAVVSANQAIADSHLDLAKENMERIGVVIGVGVGGLSSFEEGLKDYFLNPEAGPRFTPFFIPLMIIDMAAGFVSIINGFKGPNYATASACASSTHALIDAFNLIRLGKADIMVAGGSEAAVTISGIGGFGVMKALSTRNDDPEHASRPFSKSRDGFVLGEGGAALILEEYEHAVARGAHIYAEMVGGGMTADASHMTAPHPEGDGAMRVMREALNDGGLKPEDIDYINVHGTSTGLGDISEIKAIKNLFGEHAYKLNISSTKSMTGHLLGGAGALEAAISVLALENGIVPPTINHEEGDEDPEIDYKLNFTFNKAQKRDIRYAMSNTFGFGGHNATVIFKKWQ